MAIHKNNTMMRWTFIPLLFLLVYYAAAQKKMLDHSDLELWHVIKDEAISNNGQYVCYALERGEKDHYLKLSDDRGNIMFRYDRGQQGKFSDDSKYLVFTIKSWQDSITAFKQRKMDKDDYPKDTLGIYDIAKGSLVKIANVKSFKMPEKWGGYLAFQLEEIKESKKPEAASSENLHESTNTEKKEDPGKSPKLKKVGKDNGYHLVLYDLNTHRQDTFSFVQQYVFAKEAARLGVISSGESFDSGSHVLIHNITSRITLPIYAAPKAVYHEMAISDSGQKLAFVVDSDTTQSVLRPNEIWCWQEGHSAAQRMLSPTDTPSGYHVSKHGKISFSQDESKLYFGLATSPVYRDEKLTDDEIVNVEVWTYDEPVLYTVQEIQLKSDTTRSLLSVIHLDKANSFQQLSRPDFPHIQLGNEGNASFALLHTTTPYDLQSQWTGRQLKNYSLVNTTDGSLTPLLSGKEEARLSPQGRFVYGYDPSDSTWFAYNIAQQSIKTSSKDQWFYDEENDSPDFPNDYGMAGWTDGDSALILYDRYDLWCFDPTSGESRRLTSGRESNTRYRYLKLDHEARTISMSQTWLLSTFNDKTKDGGYVRFMPNDLKVEVLMSGPFSFSAPIKAQKAEKVLYTRQSFKEFPDLQLADMGFNASVSLSNANPQQGSYNWGTIELVKWTSLDGQELSGLLIKPENFDPKRKYPLLVNFYERSADDLHRHRVPKAERSSINYSFYTSREYIIFNPDIHYRLGYPGESAYDCVIPGVTSLIEKGYIDKNNIGVQGHSWGGYQIAYLVTKTDIFKAAESGAPVVNMFSAYSGIRWWTGLSRQFQYEHQQSRIGGSPWEYPIRYIENSPIFSLDKINTPLLLMHNDADGHVPWYQGIEFFLGLRRLGKPAWMLNYNGEPHWPVKHQNRKDFNIRMAQFFDHYLKNQPMPEWMQKGVPAMMKGIDQGYDLVSPLDDSKE